MLNISAKKTIPRFRDRERSYYDYSLVAVIILLIVFGLIMLYSTSSYVAQLHQGDDMFYFGKQAVISAASVGAALVISQLDYHWLEKIPTLIYTAAMIFMIMVKVTPLGVEVNGAKRWLKLGIQFQPAEIAKIAAIVVLSFMVVKMGKQAVSNKGMGILAGTGGMLGLVTLVFTDNLSTAIIIWGITGALIFIAHPKTKPFVLGFIGLVAFSVAGVMILAANIETSSNFRVRRLLTWLRPEEYSASGGYQVMQSLYAIGSGGFFGKGLGNSAQKLGWIPEAQNDMIFSVICEELGIFGASVILLLFSYLLYRLMFIAQNAPDMFGSLLVSGIFVHIALQVILNICVVTNLIPTTGITLPFFSYGGTSILFLMSEMGIALSVARRIKFQEEDRK